MSSVDPAVNVSVENALKKNAMWSTEILAFWHEAQKHLGSKLFTRHDFKHGTQIVDLEMILVSIRCFFLWVADDPCIVDEEIDFAFLCKQNNNTRKCRKLFLPPDGWNRNRTTRLTSAPFSCGQMNHSPFFIVAANSTTDWNDARSNVRTTTFLLLVICLMSSAASLPRDSSLHASITFAPV